MGRFFYFAAFFLVGLMCISPVVTELFVYSNGGDVDLSKILYSPALMFLTSFLCGYEKGEK